MLLLLLPVLVAVPVLPPARILLPCYLFLPKFLSWPYCRRVSPERKQGCCNMVAQMDKEGFGSCTNTDACEAECPKEISVTNIARLNREYLDAVISGDE